MIPCKTNIQVGAENSLKGLHELVFAWENFKKISEAELP